MGRFRLPERGVHRTGGSVPHVRQHVTVDVEAYIGVAQEILDVLRVDALAQEKRGARVPESWNRISGSPARKPSSCLAFLPVSRYDCTGAGFTP